MTSKLIWKTSRRTFDLRKRPLVMGILNITPDSFSDGGRFAAADDAFRQAEQMISEGADIIDIGGESTRPGSSRVPPDEEAARVIPVIEAAAARFDVPISIDTTKSEVAAAALAAGAEIVNDISGLRFDPKIAGCVAETGAGLVLMHSRGNFENMHSQPPVTDIFEEVRSDLARSIAGAEYVGVSRDCIALDIGIGFGKTLDQNLQLLSGLDRLAGHFREFPILVGVSRKSFLGRILNNASAGERLAGSVAAAALAVWNGASIIRAHDVRATADAILTASVIRDARDQ